MKAILFFTALFFFVGCKSQLKFNGSMVVDNEMVLVSDGSTVEVLEGTYSSEIKFKSKKRIRLKIMENGKTHKLYISSKKDIRPKSDGSFELLAKSSSLNFDILGTMNESSTLGKSTSDYEPCTYQEPVTVCHPGPQGMTCSTQMQSRSGLRDIEYKDKRIETDLDVSLFEPQSKTKMASYNGKSIQLERIYSYEGICR